MRKLVYVPMVHTMADMGSMKEGLKKEGIEKIGEKRWIENQKKIEKFWNAVESEIDTLRLNYRKVRIYQDGLPCCGELAMKIINETADAGSKNYQIVRKLISKGATIEATESPDLLRKEYEYIKAFVNANSEDEKINAKLRYDEVKDELMGERDAFIAKTINTTLKENEAGILFIGASHNAVPKLAKDIKVRSLVKK